VSETQAQVEIPGAPADFFSVSRETATDPSGEKIATMKIEFGEPKRALTVRSLTLQQQFDLIEIAGDNATNDMWMLHGQLAMGTIDVDGVAQPTPTNRTNLRGKLSRIRRDGWAAYTRAMVQLGAEDQAAAEAIKTAAKNL
jgi:N-acetylglutamate synthase/N-acetylornithine aminotransferase